VTHTQALARGRLFFFLRFTVYLRLPHSQFAAPLALALTSAAWAQTNKPGPMQSGQHATPPPAAAPATAASGTGGHFDPKQLFANVCGWCHSSGGREAGKGPKLMGTELTDSELAYRIKNGKTGQMPAFGTSLNEQQIAAVVAYIRNLKPEGGQPQ
jgi:mono/diheme cytochrome c family protein